MTNAARTLTLSWVQAIAYQAKTEVKRVGSTNFLVELRGTDPDGNTFIGLGEGQPRDAATGDRGGTSWECLTACLKRLHDREIPVTDSAAAVRTVRTIMDEAKTIAEDFNVEAGRLVPFRGTLMGLEMAMLDLMARAVETPLVTLLGSRRSKIEAHAAPVSSRLSPQVRRSQLHEHAVRFPTTLLFGTNDIEHSLELLESAAEVHRSDDVGEPDKPLWIDLNGRLSRREAKLFVKRVAQSVRAGRLPRQVVIEQPVASADYGVMPTLQRIGDRATAPGQQAGAQVQIMADQSFWKPATLGRRARAELGANRFNPMARTPRAAYVKPAQVGGLLASMELAERIHAANPAVRIVLGGMLGGTDVTAGALRNLAMAMPELDSVADLTLSDEPVIAAPTEPGIGAAISYEDVLGGAKEFFSIPAPKAPMHEGLAPNVYPEVTYLQPLGSNGTKGHLLEREALALGLSTVRYSKGAFTASDGVHEPMSFKWSRSPLSSAVSLALCTHKEATRLRLRRAGVPVPRGSTFAAGAHDAAREFVKRIGYPVVVKPAMGVRGIGVAANIRDDEALQAAFDQLEASKLGGDDFIVEQHVNGRDYRIVVIGEEVIGAILREPGSVTGDGVRSVAELVIAKNVARRDNPHLWGRPVKYDEAARFQMERAGISLGYVPTAGEKVVLSGSCSLSQGGESIDVLDELHSEIKDAAIRAVKAVPGLAFCGVDFLIEDHTKPLDGQQAGICELNAHAAIGNCEYPLYGEGREVAQTLMQKCVDEFGLVTTDRADRLALRVTIRGRVGGIGYEDWIQRRADKYGLVGRAWKADPRTIEAVVIGGMEPATALVAAAVLGPRAAIPTDVTTTHLAGLPMFDSFEIVNRAPKEFRGDR